MPSLRHSSAMLSSPRRPCKTMRILSSAEKRRRVARRMSRTVFSALSGARSSLCLIGIPPGATMSQKLFLPQSPQSVQHVLTGYTDSLSQGIGIQRAWRDGEMLPGAGQIREAQIDHSDVLVLDGLEDVVGGATIEKHELLSHLTEH